jgi:hypothetical protein
MARHQPGKENTEVSSELVVTEALLRGQGNTNQRHDEARCDSIGDSSPVTHAKARPAEIRIQPVEMAIIVTGIRSAQTEPPLESPVEHETVHGTGVAVALVGHQQTSAAGHSEIGLPKTVHDADNNVVLGEA